MKKHQFDEKLKKLNLTKKKFAELSHMSYNTVLNWNDTTKPIPKWVYSWLFYYEKAQNLNELLNCLKKIAPINK
jgi:predicted Zn-dependent peptidase